MFFRLAKDPDPGRLDYGIDNKGGPVPAAPGTTAAMFGKGGVPAPPSGAPGAFPGGVPPPPGETPAQAQAKSQVMALKNEKIAMLRELQRKNHINYEQLQIAFRKADAADKSHSKEIALEMLANVLGVEVTGEFRRIFSLFDADGSGTLDYREFILGLLNATTASRPEKVRLIYEIFDDDKNGFITEGELVQILQANHLATNPAQVKRKAATIMRQADKDGDNRLSLEELLVISEKFPNVLFPRQTVKVGKKK